MKKCVFLALLLLSALSFGTGKPTSFSGTVTVSFGYVRNLDGSIRSLKGMKLPYYAEPIQARSMHIAKKTGHGPSLDSNGASYVGAPPVNRYSLLPISAPKPFFSTTIYNADAGSGYGIIDTADPSSNDDMVLQGGSGLPWQNLTFGVDISDVHSFLIRWIGYTTYTDGLGHDLSAFSGVFNDFGVIFPANQIPGIGTYKVTISVAAAGVVAPSNTIFMAQQFRSTQPDGEGPFDTSLHNVYNPAAPPSVGNSDNVFWYDWDPMNGIYTQDEIDNFGDTNFANMLRTITINGSQDTLVPFSYTLLHGVYSSGDITDLWYSDDSYLRAVGDFGGTGAAIQLTVSGLSTTTNVTSLTFIAEAKGLTAGGTQRVSLWNYITSAYDLIDTRSISNTDSVVSVTITNTPTKYVNQSNRNMKALIELAPLPLRSVRSWNGSIDRMGWVITHP